MTTISQSYPSHNLRLFIVFVCLTFVTALIVAAGQHAFDRRLTESPTGAAKVNSVINCVNRGGTIIRMINPANNRRADICLLSGTPDMGNFGVNITTEDGQPVTTILKEKLHCVDQVVRWLANTGYTIVQ